MDSPPAPSRAWRRIPSGIWALGMVSLLMDVSSEMIHALLPVYLVVGLGTSALAVGLIEGAAEATAAITKVFSGALSDRIGRRKELAALGYGLAALTKPVFPLAGSLGWLVAARITDRFAKGFRGAPRDALIADLAPADLRGASFGLRQSLDTVGAVLGPLLAIALMWAFANDFRSVFWVAVIPAALAVAVIVLAVHEPPHAAGPVRNPLSRRELGRLGGLYWWVVAVGAVFTLARFSEAFLILRAQTGGFALALVPLVLVVMSLAYSLSAYPAGVLSDRGDRVTILVAGPLLLIAADLVLAFAQGIPGVLAGVALWGVHMGVTQGLLAALVVDTAPPDLRGTAFGMFNLVSGAALLVSSALAGALWQAGGPQWTFLAGAGFAALTLAGLVPLWRRTRA